MMRRRMMMQAAQASPEEQWDYIIYKGPGGRIPVKALSVTAGQQIYVEVTGLSATTGNVYYSSNTSCTNPRVESVSSVGWTVGVVNTYTIPVIGKGTVRISSGTNSADGAEAYYSFYADVCKIRIINP